MLDAVAGRSREFYFGQHEVAAVADHHVMELEAGQVRAHLQMAEELRAWIHGLQAQSHHSRPSVVLAEVVGLGSTASSRVNDWLGRGSFPPFYQRLQWAAEQQILVLKAALAHVAVAWVLLEVVVLAPPSPCEQAVVPEELLFEMESLRAVEMVFVEELRELQEEAAVAAE